MGSFTRLSHGSHLQPSRPRRSSQTLPCLSSKRLEASICFARRFGQLPQGSTVLAAARLGRGVTGLPTWAADFSLTIHSDEDSRLLFAQRGIYGDVKPTLDVPCKLVNSALLQLQAVTLGRVQRDIVFKGPGPMRNDEEYLAPQKWLKSSGIEVGIAQCSNNRQATYTQANELANRAYWRTLLMDCAAYPITRLTTNQILAGDAAFQKIF